MTQAQNNPDPTHQWLLHGDLPCLNCQYNLRGLVGPIVQCPECGHANDLRDPSPWRKQKLPTGMLVREHWPASAALASLVTFVILPIALASMAGIFVGGHVPYFAALLPLPLLAIVLTWWILSCLRWLRSCANRLWGWSVLAGAHLAMWGTLFGAVIGIAAIVDRRWTAIPPALPAAMLVASVLAFFWLRSIIRKADGTGQFRSDWRKWQVPTGGKASATEAER